MRALRAPEIVREADKQLRDQSFNQTKVRGSNTQEYEIYRANAEDLGWRVKSYEEWLRS